jgi:Xaa-Pro aminopeptidase
MQLPSVIFSRAGTVFLRNDDTIQDENLFYLLGRKPSQDTACLFLRKGKKPVLLVSGLELGNYAKYTYVRSLEKKSVEKALAKTRGRLGVNFERLTAAQIKKIRTISKARVIDVSVDLGKIRETKSPREIRNIKQACKITLEIMEKIPQFARRHRTERGLALRMEYEAKENGAEDIAFPVIVASGKNSSIPHHSTSTAKITQGFMVIDFGVKSGGYCSDITRTFYVGNPGKREIEIFDAVFSAKESAIRQCVEGNKAKNVHIAAEEKLKMLGEKIPHSVGHGIGLRTHDYPQTVGPQSEFRLRKNMVITIEPGYYKKNFGGVRIEDIVVIKKNKCMELTRAENGFKKLAL